MSDYMLDVYSMYVFIFLSTHMHAFVHKFMLENRGQLWVFLFLLLFNFLRQFFFSHSGIHWITKLVVQ